MYNTYPTRADPQPDPNRNPVNHCFELFSAFRLLHSVRQPFSRVKGKLYCNRAQEPPDEFRYRRRDDLRGAPSRELRDNLILLDNTHLADPRVQLHLRGGSGDRDESAATTSD